MLLWLILLTFTLIYWLFFRQLKLRLPGPSGLPILGSVLEIDSARSHVTFTEWAQKYGPVYVVKLFRDQAVIVNDYKSIHDVLVKRGDDFSARSEYYRSKLVSRGFKGIFTASPSSPQWRFLRKAAHKYVKVYSGGRSQDFEKLIGNAITYQIETIASYKGEPFNVRQQFYNFGECIMFMLLFGESLDPSSELAKQIREVTESLISNLSIAGSGVLLDLFPWLGIFPNRTYKDIMQANESGDALWNRLKEKIECDENSVSFVRHMLNLKNSLKSAHGQAILDDTNVQMATSDLLAAGGTTTVSVISSFILLMIRYPDVQRNLQKEVDAVVGKVAKVTLAKRDDMPYTRAAILELLRYATVAPLSLRAATRDTTINGAIIPKGTTVIVNLWHLHHDVDFWGDPWTYRPERYIDANGDLLPVDHPNRKRLLPFGAGPRVCLGEQFALNRLFLLITSMLQRFNINADTAKKPQSCDPRTYVTGLVVHPDEDSTVSMTTRCI